MNDIIAFYSLAHICISFVGSLLLLAIYFNIRSRFYALLEEENTQNRVDNGLLYLGLAVFVWVLSGLWSYMTYAWLDINRMWHYLGVHLLSIANNFFLLLALYYFRYAPTFIYRNRRNTTILFLVIVAITVLTFFAYSFTGQAEYLGITLQALPDFIMSTFLSYILGVTLYRTFTHRGLPIVGGISVVIVFMMLLSQIPDLISDVDSSYYYQLFKVISKHSLIAIFLVLATTWVIELSNTPRAKDMMIRFDDWSLIRLSIPSKNIHDQPVDFGSKHTQFKNLLKMGLRRKYGAGENQCIVVGGKGEISSQTYLTRIIDNINDILDLEYEDKLERKDLFTFTGEGKYRLRILSDHISVEKNLLHEILQNDDFQRYKSICE